MASPAFPDFTPTIPVFARTLAKRHGTRELIVQDERRLGYAEAERRSARLARGLIALGVGKGSRVGVLFPNGPDWIEAWWAATRIGAIAVPLNTFFQARELGWVLRHADVQVLLCCSRFLGHDYLARLEEVAPSLAAASHGPHRLPELPSLRHVVAWGDCDRGFAIPAPELDPDDVDEALLEAVEAQVVPADPMLVLYSSGSTADPKGAIHSHGTLIRHAYNLGTMRDLSPEDRVWSPMPFFWVGGLVFALVGNLHAGACTLCEETFEPGKTLRFLERERATVAIGWPHFGKALAEHPSRAERDLSSLRAGNVPDILPEAVCPADPALRANALGMTETCGPHTYAHGVLPEALRGSFGTAVPGLTHKVVDPASGARLAPGEAGEICVRGYSLMQGLHKVEREACFDDEGFYHTGDGGFFDADGVLYFEGRLGEMIKTGGANVTPSEVEAVLRELPEVADAHVVGVPDADRGEIVAAAVVLAPGARADGAELLQRARGELAAYKVPRTLVLVASEELPFTDSGKIDKRRLREQLAAAG